MTYHTQTLAFEDTKAEAFANRFVGPINMATFAEMISLVRSSRRAHPPADCNHHINTRFGVAPKTDRALSLFS